MGVSGVPIDGGRISLAAGRTASRLVGADSTLGTIGCEVRAGTGTIRPACLATTRGLG